MKAKNIRKKIDTLLHGGFGAFGITVSVNGGHITDGAISIRDKTVNDVNEAITTLLGEIEKFVDSDEMQIEEGMHYGKDVDITELPPELIAEMKGVKKGWEASKNLIKNFISSLHK